MGLPAETGRESAEVGPVLEFGREAANVGPLLEFGRESAEVGPLPEVGREAVKARDGDRKGENDLGGVNDTREEDEPRRRG